MRPIWDWAVIVACFLLLVVSGEAEHSHSHSLSIPRHARHRSEPAQAAQALEEYEAAVRHHQNFQYTFKERQGTFTVLFMTTSLDYLTAMIRVFYDLVDAFLDHPQARVIVWGPGYDGWQEQLSIQENMARRFVCGDIDIHFNFLGVFADPAHHDGRLYREWEAYKPCSGEILFEELPDCHDYSPYAPQLKCEVLQGHRNGTIISARYAFLLADLFYPQSGEGGGGMWVHTPDCANEAKVTPVDWRAKAYNATLVGSTWDQLYPLRSTIENALKADLIPGGRVQPHPGYWPFQADLAHTIVSADYLPDAPLVANATANYKLFVSRLQESKVCMFDSTVIRKSIAKFYEAFLAGCVVASDLPYEMEELYSMCLTARAGLLWDRMVRLGYTWDAIIVLPQDGSEQQVARILNAALADEAGLQRKAAHAMRLGLQHFTCHRKAERVLDYVSDFRDGFRGYYFPYGFRSGCLNYHFYNQPGKLLQPWCPGERPQRNRDL